MSFRIRIWIMLLLIGVACKEKDLQKAITDATQDLEHLMEAESLLDVIDDQNLVIVDFRKPELYFNGHIPDAVNIWRSELQSLKYPYGGMMPERGVVEKVLSAKGVEENDLIVVYDDNGSVDAARLWWLLKYYHFDAVKILNGGLDAWQASGGDLVTHQTKYKRSNFKLPELVREEMVILKADLLAELQNPRETLKLIDVRSEEEFNGQIKKSGATRAGRIPGSVHIEWSEAIDANSNNKFKTKEELERIFRQRGIEEKDTVIVYCHSGSRSSHTNFVLKELLNYSWVRNYDGSWTEWSYYDELPVETDSSHTID